MKTWGAFKASVPIYYQRLRGKPPLILELLYLFIYSVVGNIPFCPIIIGNIQSYSFQFSFYFFIFIPWILLAKKKKKKFMHSL